MARHSLTQLFVHVVWSTAGRRKVIGQNEDSRLHALLREQAFAVRCVLIAIGNGADHVHVLAELSPTVAVAELARRLKGASSFFGGWAWQRGYFAESASLADVGALSHYIARQRIHHDDSHPAELWTQK